ncbi:MAG: hypothetical protein GH151_00910 [Bacteroidetes bacterium]|nr:hypothetical protein [Bacteroidota bacterium]
MSYVRIWVHCVWGTKRAVPFITNTNKNYIIGHIRENAREKDIYVDFINAHKEHIHCLISLNPDQPISKVMQLIKGESSFWINRNYACVLGPVGGVLPLHRKLRNWIYLLFNYITWRQIFQKRKMFMINTRKL